MQYVFYLIFFGFLLTAVIGLLASWVDRKLTARVQYRVGPPLLQPLIDIVKLLGKETLVPHNVSKRTFLLAPLAGFASVVLVSTLLWISDLKFSRGFSGDIIVVICLLTIPSISAIIGAFASANPFARIGALREIRLILAYEAPFVLSVLVPIIKSGCPITISRILNFQMQNGFFICNMSGLLAFLAIIFCVQAKLALVPFDVSEAETEISGGVLIEYSGPPLAVYKLTKNMLLFVLPFFMMILFMGGLRLNGIHFLYGILEYLIILALIIVIRNTNPRLRIDQAVRFFWGPVTVVAVIAVVLALVGK